MRRSVMMRHMDGQGSEYIERGQFVTYLADQEVVCLAADRARHFAPERGDDMLGPLLAQAESRSTAELIQ